MTNSPTLCRDHALDRLNHLIEHVRFMQEMIDSRTEKIEESMSAAEKMQADLKATAARNEEALVEARKEAQQIVADIVVKHGLVGRELVTSVFDVDPESGFGWAARRGVPDCRPGGERHGGGRKGSCGFCRACFGQAVGWG